MARLVLTVLVGFAAFQQGWANGHCDADEMDLCGDEHAAPMPTPKPSGSGTNMCDEDPDMDLCEDKAPVASSKSMTLHMFEGGGCAKATNPPTSVLELNKCGALDSLKVKLVSKDDNTIYFMMGESGCTDGAGAWGTGTKHHCQTDKSACCEVESDGVVQMSYMVESSGHDDDHDHDHETPSPMPAPMPSPMPSPMPAPMPAAASPTSPTPAASSPSSAPTPAVNNEASDTANGQAPALILMLACTVGARLLSAA